MLGFTGIYDGTRFASVRKMLVIFSILFLIINVSAAKLLEANTFIFKVSFENSPGFNVLLFFGVIILTIRYYSVANVYHEEIFRLWTNDMLTDNKMLSCYRSSNTLIGPVERDDIIVDGFLSKHETVKKFAAEYLMNNPRGLNLIYYSNGLSKRHLYCYPLSQGDIPIIIKLELEQQGWTRKDFYRLLLLESKYQVLCAFKRHEFLEVILPYILAIASIMSFLNTEQVISFMASRVELLLNLIQPQRFF
ncbi:hypothetical protein [Aeromonas hydrophila]|uniref:hypothetical protein n=1 Tax=Aeromonas hydrophila TaxID=644 RepID=UPI000A47F0E2|nr:hypothetical protein [Aeromonas hydrophila]HAU4927259.1 hypothetical protein [Aeromonas hydrophila]